MGSKSGLNLNTPPSKTKRLPANGLQDKVKTPANSSPSKISKNESINEGLSFIVRPSSSTGWATVFKVYLNLDVIRQLGFTAGDLVVVSKPGEKGVVGLISPSGVKLSNQIVELNSSFRKILGIVSGERISLKKFKGRPTNAISVQIGCLDYEKLTTDESKDLAINSIKAILKDINLISPGLRFELNSQADTKSEAVVTNISGLPDIENLNLESRSQGHGDEDLLSPVFYFDAVNTEVLLSSSCNIQNDIPAMIGYSSVGGLGKQIALLRSKIELPLHKPELFKRFNMAPDRGFLLYGPPGTGKTMLLRAVAHETDAHILTINGPSIVSKYLGETESSLRSIFQEAREYEPSIIVIDEIDALVPKRDSDDSGEAESRVVSTLLTLMDGVGSTGKVVVIGATNRPNSIDPALRRPGRFGQEIEIGIPDAIGRLEILDIHFRSMPHKLSHGFIADIASKTHGYVGADLYALCRDSVMKAIQRGIDNDESIEQMAVVEDDIIKAMLDIRPSAMREIFLETPKVLWSDIGGQEHVKQKLKETVEWPLSHSETFNKLGITPPRGVLLYGPPGCSKTLIAKALATETGLNFLAVKGPELFNKFVGESERAVRETFRKARAAAPSIIFFDEIDALSAARGHGEAGGDRVLTSLLNEMDGIEALKDVIIIAATNVPDIIDTALMRPGRLDRLIYVGPPDLDARLKILAIRFNKMKIATDVDIEKIAKSTDGCSGAEVVALCQEAGIQAMNEDLDIDCVSMRHFDAALKGIRKGITKDIIDYFEEFARSSGNCQ
ncbi:AAA family ATPase AFG2 [Sugiyamaella lignohabitans]|uniref:AAA family ATPase AFG2 n=1 Tax=Sugiyamaella lignohabitans TaxID=796027 RepID=A0A167D7L7_9ASCO|nr:AAA family ATPase AFG2 [Sugiyamaella lignohabitans]ANB12581.1 AAA family ATPase AFG2 [Sugiyamaella lignohabitans]